MIEWDERVQQYLVEALTEDYKFCLSFGNEKIAKAIKRIIKYYLSSEDFEQWKITNAN